MPTGKLDDLSSAVVEIENFILPSVATNSGKGLKGGSLLTPFCCIPSNDILLGYWDTVADRLFKIRHCVNIEDVQRSVPAFEPPPPRFAATVRKLLVDYRTATGVTVEPVAP